MSREVYIVRVVAVFGLFGVLFALLAGHFHWLQVSRHDELATKAEAKYMASRKDVGNRGQIRDLHGNLLAANLACKDVRAEPDRIKPERRQEVADRLHEGLGVDKSVILERLNSGRKEVVICNEVDLDTAGQLAAMKLPGIRMVDTEGRYYPKGYLLANVLGFTSRTTRNGQLVNEGVCGIEKVYDGQLSPRQGLVTYQRDRKGRQLFRSPPVEDAPLDGKHLYLTVQEPLQHILEEELKSLCEQFAPQYAYAIMAQPSTGAIMAIAQYPSFDPNERRPEERDYWVSHFVSDVYEPGSAMKGLIIASALDYGVVTLQTRYDCEGGYWFYKGKTLRDAGHHYQTMTVAQIIQKSSNIGTAKIGLTMGEERLYQTLRRCGFGATTNIGLPAESRGILRAPKDWDSLSITRFPIGQGVAVTPLQMVQAYCALANNGQMMQLHLVDRIEDPVTGQVTRIAPTEKHLFVRKKYAQLATQALKLVTLKGGTATRAHVPGYDVAGKTGTAQKFLEGTYNSGKYVSSFIGYVPADDPAFVLLIVADEPSKEAYYGGTVCGPSFRRIAAESLRYLNVPPTDPDEVTTASR